MAGFMLVIQVLAQVPSGYYDSAEGLYETQLQQALHNIIDNHSSLSYDDLWDAFEDTDPRPENSNLVYDMYSDNPDGPEPYTFTFGTDQCGNYSVEGDCYNREHSWPKSWFNDASPMYTDLVHLVPTDGKVNGYRSNYPYGEVTSVTWTSQNGSKLGYTSASWTSDKVFEPIDEYKGDFARIYFYMSVRYYGEDGSWNENDMVDGSQLKPGPLAMMMQWHQDDPVSDKERYRNECHLRLAGKPESFCGSPGVCRKHMGRSPGCNQHPGNGRHFCLTKSGPGQYTDFSSGNFNQRI